MAALLGGLTMLGLLAAAGCGGSEPAAEPMADSRRESPAVFDVNREPPPPTYTVTRGEYNAPLPESFADSLPGLEVLSWVTIDPGGRVAAALEALEDEPGSEPQADATELARWARSGLMVRRVPLEDLTGLLRAMPPMDALSRRAWGSVPEWQPALTARQPVDRMRIYDGAIDRDPGSTPRLLMRGWVEAVVEAGRTGSRVRAELVPQFYVLAKSSFEPVATLTRESEKGTVLGELMLSVSLERGTALLITAEPPAEQSLLGTGPPVPRLRSLGSSLFRLEPEAPSGSGESKRAIPPAQVGVLVLVPVLPQSAVVSGRP